MRGNEGRSRGRLKTSLVLRVSTRVDAEIQDRALTDLSRSDRAWQRTTPRSRSSGDPRAIGEGGGGQHDVCACMLENDVPEPGISRSALDDASSRPDKKLVTIMSLPVRSCLCRRHSERFGGPLGPRQWLRLLRRSTCSKRGSVRTVFFFFSSIGSFFFFFFFGGGGGGGRSVSQSVEFDGEGTRSKETRVERVVGASRYMYDSEIEFVYRIENIFFVFFSFF